MDLDTAAFVFYGAILLLSLGEAGRSAALKEFLHQQFLSQPKNPRDCTDEQQGLDFRRKPLWALPWYLGAVIALLRLKATWVRTFMISTFAMGVSYVAFLFGFSSYSFIDNKESLVFEREASIEEAQNQENDIVKQEERGKEPCQASGSLSLRLDKILAGGGSKFWALIKKLIKEKKLLVQEMLATWLAYLGCSVVMTLEARSSLNNSVTWITPFLPSQAPTLKFFSTALDVHTSRNCN
ncbi:protein NRT1/ PTR FAMILY 5.13-like [Prunus yedoensis var. nudiflora]|uniref:Protein NRT1/ PTR FAMILY 5.13-like n=1 Tax=Prunus yedoensis var. nudiflora TaxID=2094558 RepID=A0A314XHC1_PRUYE|nr:protein NRT1/ PTR FAMILY 5.13-like [Prunus yedoensis var. nudiflora]